MTSRARNRLTLSLEKEKKSQTEGDDKRWRFSQRRGRAAASIERNVHLVKLIKGTTFWEEPGKRRTIVDEERR